MGQRSSIFFREVFYFDGPCLHPKLYFPYASYPLRRADLLMFDKPRWKMYERLGPRCENARGHDVFDYKQVEL